MSYNKKAHLRANIDAIKVVFSLDKEKRTITETEQDILMNFSGFGGLKCVLNPASSLADVGQWAKSELELFPMVAELHRVLKENTSSEQEYKQYLNSIKNSVLTSFYTPPSVVQTIADTIRDSGVTVNHFLDPSAGMGEFASAFSFTNLKAENTCFEKDLLTGKMLSYINPDDKVKIEGFETIESRYNNYFDLISSNIPFGEMSVFDADFRKSDDPIHQQSTKAIHNYFFVKGIEILREGGILAFITSQGVMNSPSNEPIRQWLMEKTNLISAIRLPNNLFSDIAGTDVGSDLIILQKDTSKLELSAPEKNFISTSEYSAGFMKNDTFENYDRVIHTKGYMGTDPYGKATQIFEHEGGIEDIATDLKRMLNTDLSKHLNFDLYNQHQRNAIVQQPSAQLEIKEKVRYQALEVNVSEPVVTLYDLFGFTQEERTQVKTKRRTSRRDTNRKPAQLNLFADKSKSEFDTKSSSSYPISDARKNEQQEALRQQEKLKSLELRPFAGDLKEHHKEGSLVEDDGQIGYLKYRYKDESSFQALDLHFAERSKISDILKYEISITLCITTKRNTCKFTSHCEVTLI